MTESKELRRLVVTELVAAGYEIVAGQLVPPDTSNKDAVRSLHMTQRRQVLVKNERFIREWEDQLLPHFAAGSDVDPSRIEPVLEVVESDAQAALFRFAALHWSVPVSQGYGRRTRFLLRDGHNGKLLGIFALGDPVFNLKVRDVVIGWDQEQRQDRLYNVFDAFVMGAVHPYRELIGGKLVALAAVSNEVQTILEHKYRGVKTTIRGLEKDSRPALITTTSALGRSSVYNRIRYHDRHVYSDVGYTQGFGHFQFSDKVFQALVELVSHEEDYRSNQYGQGPNWKMRTIRKALGRLGLPGDLLKHGIRREVYMAPLGVGWRAFLRGQTDSLNTFDYPLPGIGEFFRDRWAVPRAARRPEYADWDADNMRLTPLLTEDALRQMVLL